MRQLRKTAHGPGVHVAIKLPGLRVTIRTERIRPDHKVRFRLVVITMAGGTSRRRGKGIQLSYDIRVHMIVDIRVAILARRILHALKRLDVTDTTVISCGKRMCRVQRTTGPQFVTGNPGKFPQISADSARKD